MVVLPVSDSDDVDAWVSLPAVVSPLVAVDEPLCTRQVSVEKDRRAHADGLGGHRTETHEAFLEFLELLVVFDTELVAGHRRPRLRCGRSGGMWTQPWMAQPNRPVM